MVKTNKAGLLDRIYSVGNAVVKSIEYTSSKRRSKKELADNITALCDEKVDNILSILDEVKGFAKGNKLDLQVLINARLDTKEIDSQIEVALELYQELFGEVFDIPEDIQLDFDTILNEAIDEEKKAEKKNK